MVLDASHLQTLVPNRFSLDKTLWAVVAVIVL